MSDVNFTQRPRARHARIRASLAPLTCFLRNVPLFFRAAPATPLRVLCLIALDTLHVLRHSRPLSKTRISELATFLDFQACTNAAWDRKYWCETDYEAMRRRLEKAGLGLRIDEYITRVGALERQRPSTGGDRRRFDEVRAYREAVARLSLATLTAIALNEDSLEQAVRANQSDNNVDILFRIVMQCQIIDDVVDYAEDWPAGLPSFLTATASRPEAVALTAQAAQDYAAVCERSTDNAVFALRMALWVVTALTKLVVRVARPAPVPRTAL